MIKIKKGVKENTVIIDNTAYPATRHNLEVWKKYQATKEKRHLERLSKIVLDI